MLPTRFFSLLFFWAFFAHSNPVYAQKQAQYYSYEASRPWARLWWFADTTAELTITQNLDYLKAKGFGGVECAFIYPYNRKSKDYAPRNEWLSPAFVEKVRFAKEYAQKIGLGCDLTLGTLWPFGDEFVPKSEATMCLMDSSHTDSMKYIWSHPTPGLVIDHLSKTAVRHYGKRLTDAFAPVLQSSGTRPLLFVDSWEVGARYLATNGFEEDFYARYGYKLKPYRKRLYSKEAPYPQVLYDYRKMVSEYVIDHFYKEFTEIAHESGTFSRGQAAGAPCDILEAYAALDVPESEAMLYEPQFSNIPAAAAALSGKKVVSAETFTCLYGFPADHFKKEQTADLKLLADAMFAQGVNQVIWHGKPMGRTEKDTFYATVHIGSSGALDPELEAFNGYLTTVSREMKQGSTFGKVAVYLPTEDAWINGELPIEKQKIWSWGYYEMRENVLPAELKPWRPMWINQAFLKAGTLQNGQLVVGDLAFNALYVDAQYLDISVLGTLVALAERGFPMVLKQMPLEPGMRTKPEVYRSLIDRLQRCKNVTANWKNALKFVAPVVTGKNIPDYWCRETADGLSVFFAAPRTKSIKFPMEYGQSFNKKTETTRVSIHYNGHVAPVKLLFEPYQSVLVKVSKDGAVQFEPIAFVPKTPVVVPRAKKARERWEVDPAEKQVCH